MPFELDDLQVDAKHLGPLPLAVAIIEGLGIARVLDEMLPIDPRSNISDSDCIVAMILNILGGRIALYRMEGWTRKLPVKDLFGEHCKPEDFSDARLARALDHLFEVGTDCVLSEVVRQYLAREDRPTTYSVHQDTTSVAVHGAYEGEPPDWAPQMLRGFSKDHRPDLKQLVFGLSLHGSTGMPLMATMFDGNTSDKYANTFHIEGLVDLLPDEDEVTMVGDSKLVEAQTLGALVAAGFHFVSLVSRSFAVRDDVLDRLCAEADLPELGRTAARRKADPDSVYCGRSYRAELTIQRPFEKREDKEFRFLAVHSSSLVAKVKRQLPDRLVKERKALLKQVAKTGKQLFSCEHDAENAAEKLEEAATLWMMTIHIEAVEVRAKRGRGRPKVGAEPKTDTRYQLVIGDLVLNQTAIAAHRRTRSHFVLVTDHLDEQQWSDERILAEYRKQGLIEGHTGFRWLKGPGQISPLLLKKEERIAALGLVLVLTLMVRNYVQFTVRAGLEESGETIGYYDRKRETAKPTAEVIWDHFGILQRVVVSIGGEVARSTIEGLEPDARRIIAMLGLTEAQLFRRRSKSGSPSG
jgi:transposase